MKLVILAALLILSLSSINNDEPKILIIGDSISIGYMPFVKEDLANKATVYHNPGNAQHTGTGLKNVEEWISTETWDIVQINWGLWDLCYRNADSKTQGNRDKEHGKITYTVNEYASNLDTIIKLIKSKTNAKVIFVTTTYVPENEAGRFKEDVKKYNDAARKIMTKHSIAVNDIYETSISIHNKLGLGLDDVHYSDKGYEKLSKPITKFLKKELKLLQVK